MQDALLGAAVLGIVGAVILATRYEWRCPKCGRWGARLQGESYPRTSDPVQREEWKDEAVESVTREELSSHLLYGESRREIKESRIEKIRYEVTLQKEWQVTPSRCRHCSHAWEETTSPLEREIGRKRL